MGRIARWLDNNPTYLCPGPETAVLAACTRASMSANK
jgi:hypothetical protein